MNVPIANKGGSEDGAGRDGGGGEAKERNDQEGREAR